MEVPDAYEIMIQLSQEIAIQKKKYAISPCCFYLALLKTQNIPDLIISSHTKLLLIELLDKDVDEDYTYEETENHIPIYIVLEDIINHARFFQNELYEKKLSIKHLLLAVLSFENKVERIFSQKGIIYDDITNIDKRKKQFLLSLKRPPQVPLDFQVNYTDGQLAAFTDNTKKEQFDSAHGYANRYLSYSDFDECDNCCNYMLRLYPKNEIPLYLLGDSSYRRKNYLTAIEYFSQIQPTSKFYKHALNNIASSFFNAKDINQAENWHLKLIALWPNDNLSLNNIGFFYGEINKPDKAIFYLNKAIQLDKFKAFAYNNLGFAYYLKGEHQKAIELIEHSLTIDKGNSFAYNNLALVYLSQNDKLKAIDNLLLAKRFGFKEKYGNEVEEMFDMLMQEKEQQKTASTFTRKLFNLFKRN